VLLGTNANLFAAVEVGDGATVGVDDVDPVSQSGVRVDDSPTVPILVA
jgi:hypothetical protein